MRIKKVHFSFPRSQNITLRAQTLVLTAVYILNKLKRKSSIKKLNKLIYKILNVLMGNSTLVEYSSD